MTHTTPQWITGGARGAVLVCTVTQQGLMCWGIIIGLSTQGRSPKGLEDDT